MRNADPQVPPFLQVLLNAGVFQSARALPGDVVRAVLLFALEARRDSSPVPQILVKHGVTPRFWPMAPDWLRNQLTLLATPGVVEPSGDVPAAYVGYIGTAWAAVTQTVVQDPPNNSA